MPIRITATDLRDASRKSATVRAAAAARGETTEILLDVEVVIDRTVSTAFASSETETQSAQSGSHPLRYIGTPRGLAGLICDVQRLGIADGVVLVTQSEDQVVGLMLDELAPGLGTPN